MIKSQATSQPSRPRTLYVSDMDGTLLNNDSLISPATSRIVSDLSHNGALITVATARTPATVDPLMAGTYTRIPAIVMTGAALWDREQRRFISTQLLAPGLAADVAAEFVEAGLHPFIYTVTDPSHLDVYHSVTMNDGEDAFYQERRNLELKKFHIGVTPSAAVYDRSILLFTLGETRRAEALAAHLRLRGDCEVSCYLDTLAPGRTFIEIFAPGVSKANAVKQLAQELQVERTVVFGDNLNDLSMMAVANVSVAVANAFPQVKDAASKVIGPNSANSVAHFIMEDYQ